MLCAFWLLGRQDRTWVFRYFMLFRQKGQWSMMVNAENVTVHPLGPGRIR